MTMLQETVERALKDKAPRLHKELQEAGKLRAFVRDRAAEIDADVVSAVMDEAHAKGWNSLPVDQCSAKMKMAESAALEAVLADKLDFPPEQT